MRKLFPGITLAFILSLILPPTGSPLRAGEHTYKFTVPEIT